MLNIGLNRAVTLIAEKLLKGKGRRFGPDPGRPLGEHPVRGGQILAKNGRYGPYVSNEGVNATLPRDKTPETVTLEEAIALIDARAEVVGSAPKRRAPKKAPAARKSAAAKEKSAKAAAANAREPTKKAGKTKPGAPPAPKKPAQKKKAAD